MAKYTVYTKNHLHGKNGETNGFVYVAEKYEGHITVGPTATEGIGRRTEGGWIMLRANEIGKKIDWVSIDEIRTIVRRIAEC